MAKLTAAKRANIAKSDTAVPSKAKSKSKGGAVSGSYPIADISHARNALARSSGKSVEAQVKRKVYAKVPVVEEGCQGQVGVQDLDAGLGKI